MREGKIRDVFYIYSGLSWHNRFMLGTMTSPVSPESVCLTTIVCLAWLLFTLQSKYDFTMRIGLLFMALTFFILGLPQWAGMCPTIVNLAYRLQHYCSVIIWFRIDGLQRPQNVNIVGIFPQIRRIILVARDDGLVQRKLMETQSEEYVIETLILFF